MTTLPIIRLELDHVKESVYHMLTLKHTELSDYIIKELENQLSEDWVKTKIHDAITQCIITSIENMIDNYRLRNALEETVVDYITKTLEVKG